MFEKGQLIEINKVGFGFANFLDVPAILYAAKLYGTAFEIIPGVQQEYNIDRSGQEPLLICGRWYPPSSWDEKEYLGLKEERYKEYYVVLFEGKTWIARVRPESFKVVT